MKGVFSSVFVHRYRDVRPEIRALCLNELGVWMTEYRSAGFLLPSHHSLSLPFPFRSILSLSLSVLLFFPTLSLLLPPLCPYLYCNMHNCVVCMFVGNSLFMRSTIFFFKLCHLCICRAHFLADSHLKYVGWCLYDKVSLFLVHYVYICRDGESK